VGREVGVVEGADLRYFWLPGSRCVHIATLRYLFATLWSLLFANLLL